MKQSKTAFILSQPFDIPAKAVVSAAHNQGIKIQPGYVHVIRSKARVTGQTTVRRRAVKAAAPANDLTREFDRLALRIGYDAARERLEALLEVTA